MQESVARDGSYGDGEFRAVVAATIDGILVVTAEGVVRYANPAAAKVLGRRPEELSELPFGLPLARGTRLAELDVARPDGSHVVVEMHVAPVRWRDQLAQAVTLRDITDRVVTERRLAESEERFALSAAGANDGLWDWNIETGLMHTSPRLQEMLGFAAVERDEELGWWIDRVHPADIEGLVTAIAEHLAGVTTRLDHEHRLQCHDGSWLWVLTRGIAVRDRDQPRRLAGSMTDISDRKRAEENLRRLALHDPLTGLANRALFLDHLQGAIERVQRRGSGRFAILFFDVDHFKLVNDSLGHAAGDALLIEIGRRIERCVRVTDTVARLGGDEFAVLLDAPENTDTVLSTVRRIQNTVAAPVSIGPQLVYVSASIGIALSDDVPPEAETALRYADIAMYQAKARGRSGFEVFAAKMHEATTSRLHMHNRLREAFGRGDLFTRYQPIVDLHTGEVVGFEALLRWRAAPDRVLDAAAFIDAAEETAVIVPAGWDLMTEACRQVGAWRQAGFRGHVTVNLSDRQVADPHLFDRVAATLAAAGIDGTALHLEITERAAITHAVEATSQLNRCRSLGVAVLIDDFGTGYSSLTALHQLPLTALKIDKIFVSRLIGDVDSIVAAIVALARSLDLEVVAEGVETSVQQARLRELGCRYGQGFLFGAALDATAATRLLEGQGRLPTQDSGRQPEQP